MRTRNLLAAVCLSVIVALALTATVSASTPQVGVGIFAQTAKKKPVKRTGNNNAACPYKVTVTFPPWSRELVAYIERTPGWENVPASARPKVKANFDLASKKVGFETSFIIEVADISLPGGRDRWSRTKRPDHYFLETEVKLRWKYYVPCGRSPSRYTVSDKAMSSSPVGEALTPPGTPARNFLSGGRGKWLFGRAGVFERAKPVTFTVRFAKN